MTQPPSSRDQAIETVESLLSSLSRQDLAPFGTALHPEVIWHSDVHEHGPVQGNAGVQAVAGVYIEAFSDLAVTPEFATATFENGRLAFEFTIQGTNDGRLPGVGITGRRFRVDASAVVTFDEDGRITEVRTYWNCAVALAHLGIRAYARPGPRPAATP